MDCEHVLELVCGAIYSAAKKIYLVLVSDKIAGYIRAYEQELDAYGPVLDALKEFDRVLGCGAINRAYEDAAREVCRYYREHNIDHNESFCRKFLTGDA